MDAEESDRDEFEFVCWACGGSGECSRCEGNGSYMLPGRQAIVDCPRCDGSGACTGCKGTGWVRPEVDDG